MQVIANGFWDYARRWRESFQQERKLHWEQSWLENAYCADCRFCCGPQDSAVPFPMPLLSRQLRPELNKDFYLLDAATPYLGQAGCKADTAQGCRLELAQKPVACGLFPIVLVNGGLYLYQNCPAVIHTPLARFLEFAQKAAALLMQLDEIELRHLSLWLTADILAKSYIDLRVKIFSALGKELVYE